MDKKSLKRIRLVVLDVDGIMTDGCITIGGGGGELKTFSVVDGAGIKYLQRSGIPVAFLSGRSSKATVERAGELGIDEIHHGIKNKLPVFLDILKRLGISENEACYMGDDLMDIPILNRTGYAATVPEAREEVKKVASYITKASGGRGAVREVAEQILKAQGLWEKILERYIQ